MKFKFYFLVLFLISTVSVSAQDEVITDTTKMNYKILFMNNIYYRVNYTYKSVAPDGVTPVTLSAALVFPQTVFERTKTVTVSGKEYNASGLMLNNHFTMTKQSDAPTQASEMTIEGPLAALGPNLIIISPDGYGFGTTVDKPQAYLMADITARNNIDAVKAARRLLSQMNYTYGDLFTQVGYSQGGHSAMAVQRYVDTQNVDPEAIPYINYTFCGDGPYDLSSMLDTLLLPDARFRYPCALPLIFQGQIGGAGLDVSYSDCFRAPLDTKTIEWLDAKKYSTDAINDSIYAVVGGDSETGVLVSDILCAENFTPSNTKMEPLFQAIQENTLVTGWTPNSETRFFLYHSPEDEIVPFFCMEHLRDFLKNDCGIGEDRLEVQQSSGTHVDAATFFVVSTINRLRDLEEAYLEGTFIPTSVKDIMAVNTSETKAADGWYNLQGQRLPGRPHMAGLYIYNGKKIMVGQR